MLIELLIIGLTNITSMSHIREDESDDVPTKIVTIKGVDRHLYSQFSKLVVPMTASSGLVFSHILKYYLMNIKPLIPIATQRDTTDKSRKVTYETIENQVSLTISQDDFEALKMNVQFNFKNINRLIFDKTVDTNTMMTFVHGIYDSKVEVLGNISKLLLLSITRSKLTNLKISGDLKDITIRNVRVSIYEEFAAMCHKHKITIGEGINRMLISMVPHLEIVEIIRHFVKPINRNPIIISSKDTLTVSSKDLKDLDGKQVIFHRIDNLKFDTTLPTELFSETILGIYNCDQVNFPKNLPKLIKLSKQKYYP